jgi:hypothetical protein
VANRKLVWWRGIVSRPRQQGGSFGPFANALSASLKRFYSFRFYRHYSLHSDSPNNSRQTSSQGINSTVPASISTKRRWISVDHAASTSGSDIGSTLLLELSLRLLHASLSLPKGSAAVSFGVLVHLHGSTVRGRSPMSCGAVGDWCAHRTFRALRPESVAKIRCGKFCAWKGFWISRNSRKNGADQVTPLN